MSVLSVSNLTVAYGAAPIVGPLSFSIAPGECVALTGASGAGKTSVALALMGLLPAAARVDGRASLGGTELVEASEATMRPLRGSTLAYVAQDAGGWLDPVRRVGAQLREAITVHDRSRRPELADRVAVALKRVGLDPETVSRRPHELSGGMRQRVALAMAGINAPALLITDEPTSALDPANRSVVAGELRRLMSDGTGVLLITHDRAFAEELGARVVPLASDDTSTAARPASPSEPDDELVLRASGVTIGYGGRPVLDGVDLEVRRGETVAVVGPSGSGKTTLARSLARLVEPDAGAVVIGGTDVTRLKGRQLRRARAAFRYMPQDSYASLDPKLTIRQSLLETLHAAGQTDEAGRVDAALSEVGIEQAMADRRPPTLSGGQRTRAALARALITRPRLLLLDEPLASVDPARREHLMSLLLELQNRHRFACVLVSHDAEVVARLSHRVLHLEDGRLMPAI